MTSLKLQNSLTRKKETFVPIDASHVRLYACGPTVYNYAHIGNARMAVTFDVLARVLRANYPKVTYVSNITDVDDKIIKAAVETGEDISTITEKYTNIYNADMTALGVQMPDIQPRATGHIDDMINIIQTLIEKQYAYAAEGHVLFHVPSFDKYGGLSGRSRDEQIAGARVEIASYKKDPADFVLWKPSLETEPGWESPWGFGRPGWHIECSAMAAEHLGLPFDIHGGGADLKFPHHENEIAQSCCAHGNPNDLSSFSKYWVHNGFVTVNGEKMSKSIGNVTLAHDLLETYKGETLRLTLLSAHYRQPLDWSEKSIEQSQKTLDRIYQSLREFENVKTESTPPPQNFMEALNDDLNTPKAISIICELSRNLSEANLGEFRAATKLLGLGREKPSDWLGYGAQSEDSDKIETLIAQRKEAKENKDYARSDEIRDELTAMGIAIEDTADGTVWKKV